MHDDGDSISRELDVQLPGIGSGLPAEPRRFQSILRSISRSTPVCDNQGPAAIRREQVKKPVHHVVPRRLADMVGAISVRFPL